MTRTDNKSRLVLITPAPPRELTDILTVRTEIRSPRLLSAQPIPKAVTTVRSARVSQISHDDRLLDASARVRIEREGGWG